MVGTSFENLLPRIETECYLLQAILYRNKNQHRRSHAYQWIQTCGQESRNLVKAVRQIEVEIENPNQNQRKDRIDIQSTQTQRYIQSFSRKHQQDNNNEQLQYRLHERLSYLLESGVSILSHIEKGMNALHRDLEQLYFVNIGIVLYSILARLFICIRSLIQNLHREYWYKVDGSRKGDKNSNMMQVPLSSEVLQILFGKSEFLQDDKSSTVSVSNPSLTTTALHQTSKLSRDQYFHQDKVIEEEDNDNEDDDGQGTNFHMELNDDQKVILAGAYSSDETSDSD